MFKTIASKTLFRAMLTLAVLASAQVAHAQSASTLRDPLISGALSSPPFVCPPEGQPPAVGDGPTPAPVTPGMGGSPELKPWVTNIPANTAGVASSGVPLPVSPSIVTPPGVLGPMLTPFIPAPPSTPGVDPGPMTAPYGSFNPAQISNINPGGGIPGTGGYYTSIPTVRRGGQESHQWGYRGRNSVLGGGGDGSQDEVTRLGPWAGWGVPYGVPTGDGLRSSSIDLGGGRRFSAGDCCTIPTGTALQDYGLSSTRDNPLAPINARQSYEFGQGMRREPQYSSKTSDFGFPYMQFDPANTNPQKQDQLLLPYAVLTNF